MDRASALPRGAAVRQPRPVRRLLVTAAAALPYPVLLVVATAVLDSRPADARARWLDGVSTDLVNLADHPVRSVVLSACVTEEHAVPWAVLALVGLAALVWRRGPWRPLVLVLAVHVLATGVSQGLIALRIAQGWLPGSARVMRDIGPSYVVIAALVGAIGYGTLAGRVAGALGFGVLAPTMFDGLGQLDVAAVGHTTSAVLALALGAVLLRGRDVTGDGGRAGDGVGARTRRPRLARRPPAPSANRGLEPRAR